MIPAPIILSAMLSLPPYGGDLADTPEQRIALYLPVAESIARVAKTDRQAALLIAQTFEDTGMARYVYEGRCKDGPRGARCDDGASQGPWQTSVRYCPTTNLDEQARCAMKAAGGGVTRCGAYAKSRTHALFIGMAGSRVSCRWKAAEGRVATYRTVLARLRAQTGGKR